MTRPIGVLLAAGRGRRMGRTKQLLPWPADGGPPLVAAAFDAVAPVCDRMVVVLGHDAQAVRTALTPREFTAITVDPDAPMFESVRAGLIEAARLALGVPILLHPADHPAVRHDTLDLLVAAFAADATRAVMPQYARKGGHPVLIPPTIGASIKAWVGEGGLRQYWVDHPRQCVRLTVTDPGVTRDLDTPEDYAGA